MLPQSTISIDGAGPPHWAPDGRSLYYLEPGPAMMMQAVLDFSEGIRVVERRELFSAVPFLRSLDHWQYDLTPDGTRFLMLRTTVAGTGTEIVERAGYHVLVENLLAEIGER